MIVFLDTNIFLHYQPFYQIDWLDVLGASNVEIVLPPITVNELNKHKDTHPVLRVRKRAAETIKRLFGFLSNGNSFQLKEGINFRLEDREPQIDFDEHQLFRASQDDNLIASILFCQSEIQEENIVLISSDLGLILRGKANRQKITVVPMPEKYKLPDESDPNEKKIAELEAENRRLKSAIPKLSLEFENRESKVYFKLFSPMPNYSDDEVKKLLADVRTKYPPIKKAEDGLEKIVGIDLSSLSTGLLGSITAADINAYNESLEKFYGVWESYLPKKRKFENMLGRTVKPVLWVANDGNAPAEDLDIYMHFPDGLRPFSQETLPAEPDRPNPPKKPRTPMESIADMGRLSEALPYLPALGDIGPAPNVSGFEIAHSNSYDVRFHVDRIKHKLREPADELYVVFDSYETAHSFHIDYSILAGNVGEPVEGSLHIIIDKLAA